MLGSAIILLSFVTLSEQVEVVRRQIGDSEVDVNVHIHPVNGRKIVRLKDSPYVLAARQQAFLQQLPTHPPDQVLGPAAVTNGSLAAGREGGCAKIHHGVHPGEPGDISCFPFAGDCYGALITPNGEREMFCAWVHYSNMDDDDCECFHALDPPHGDEHPQPIILVK